MIKLTDYVIETQGLITPHEVIANMKVLNSRDGSIIQLPLMSETYFESLDSECKNYKIKTMIIKYMFSSKIFYTEDLYVLNDIGKLLYEV